MSVSNAEAQASQNKTLYQRYIQEVFNEGHLDALGEFVSETYVLHDAPPGTLSGPEAIRQVVSMFRAAFPDLTITLDDLVAEGDMVCARSTTRGTHKGKIFGVAATGKVVTMPGLTMVRITEGRLVESWVKNDVMGLMQQLGPGSQQS